MLNSQEPFTGYDLTSNKGKRIKVVLCPRCIAGKQKQGWKITQLTVNPTFDTCADCGVENKSE